VEVGENVGETRGRVGYGVDVLLGDMVGVS